MLHRSRSRYVKSKYRRGGKRSGSLYRLNVGMLLPLGVPNEAYSPSRLSYANFSVSRQLFPGHHPTLLVRHPAN